MKRGVKIAVLTLVYLILCGKSCHDDQDILSKQIEEVETLKESIREEFSSDYLSEESKYATELAAIQKIKDLEDYIKIYSDASLDSTFRHKAREMIREIFIAEDVKLSFGPYRNRKVKYLTLDRMMDKGLGHDITSAEVLFDSVRIDIPLKRSGPEHYQGAMRARQKIVLYTLSDTLLPREATITVSIHATQEAKVFGKDTLNTWTVSLGEMIVNK